MAEVLIVLLLAFLISIIRFFLGYFVGWLMGNAIIYLGGFSESATFIGDLPIDTSLGIICSVLAVVSLWFYDTGSS